MPLYPQNLQTLQFKLRAGVNKTATYKIFGHNLQQIPIATYSYIYDSAYLFNVDMINKVKNHLPNPIIGNKTKATNDMNTGKKEVLFFANNQFEKELHEDAAEIERVAKQVVLSPIRVWKIVFQCNNPYQFQQEYTIIKGISTGDLKKSLLNPLASADLQTPNVAEFIILDLPEPIIFDGNTALVINKVIRMPLTQGEELTQKMIGVVESPESIASSTPLFIPDNSREITNLVLHLFYDYPNDTLPNPTSPSLPLPEFPSEEPILEIPTEVPQNYPRYYFIKRKFPWLWLWFILFLLITIWIVI